MRKARSPLLGGLLGRARGAMFFAGFTSLALNLLMLFTPLFSTEVFDRVLHSGSVETLFMLVMILVIVLATTMSLEIQRARMTTRIGEWIEDELLPAAARRAIDHDERLEKSPVQDVQTLRAFVSGPAMTSFLDLPWLPVFLAACFILHPMIGWFSLATAVFLLCLTLATEFLIGRRSEALALAGQRVAVRISEIARRAEAARGLGMAGPLVRAETQAARALAVEQRGVGDIASQSVALSKMVRIGSQSLVLALAAWLALRNEVTVGALMAASILLARALMPLDGIIAGWRGFQSAREAWARLDALLARPIHDPQTVLPPPQGELAIEDAIFTTPDGRPIIEKTTLVVPAGSMLALIGNSGSGKTTLARLIVGALSPTGGTVSLDGTSIGQWPEHQRAAFIGYLPQDPSLFAGTVKQNIARFGDVPDELVVAASQRAGCHALISGLPRGYDTPLGEAGAPLSGGQRQRIALARAILGAPRLIVLDEPNASLDAAGDQALLETLTALKNAGSTIILVSHRPAVLSIADRIAVMENGRVVHVGPSQSVIRSLSEAAEKLRRSAGVETAPAMSAG